MFQQLPYSRSDVENLIGNAQNICKFPVDGVTATVQRQKVRFKINSEAAPIPS